MLPEPESRRRFVKKSLAASIAAAQPTFFAGLVRATGGGETTSLPETTWVYDSTYLWTETTVHWTTVPFDSTPIFQTTVPQTTHIDTTIIETTRVCDLHVKQTNFPTLNNYFTDSGNPHEVEILPGNDPIAYINGVPEVPALKARLQFGNDPIPADKKVKWYLEITSERSERATLDNVRIPTSGTVELAGDEYWDIGAALAGKFVGGDVTLHFESDLKTGQAAFKIRGANPLDATAKGFITAKSATLGKYPYAWAIAEKESKQTILATSVVYNQFNVQAPSARPNLGAPYGWGMGQIDRGSHAAVSTEEVYNWKTNIDALFAKLNEKSIYANTVLKGIERRYPSDPAATEANAPSHTVSWTVGAQNFSQTFSAKDLLIIIGYNGFGSCGKTPTRNINGTDVDLDSALHFDPAATPKWSYHPNVNSYLEEISKVLNGLPYSD